MDWTGWIPWIGAVVMGLFAALSAGQVVGYALSRKLPTYQLLFSSFLLAIITWAISSILVGLALQLALYLWIDWSENSFGRSGLGLVLGLLGTMLILLIWRLRKSSDGRRWATAGSLIPWAIVAGVSAFSFHLFLTTDSWNYTVPEYFWSCVFLSMAIGIIVGSCAGGMIYHQTRHLRSSNKL